MVKQDELDFMRLMAQLGSVYYYDTESRTAYERDGGTTFILGRQLGIHDNRIEYLCNKWIDRGWAECGVSARTCWLTKAGVDHFVKATGLADN